MGAGILTDLLKSRSQKTSAKISSSHEARNKVLQPPHRLHKLKEKAAGLTVFRLWLYLA